MKEYIGAQGSETKQPGASAGDAGHYKLTCEMNT